MIRKEREVTDFDKILDIVTKCDVCRIAFFDEEFPYIIPMSFGIKRIDDKLEMYFHCGNSGKKLDLLSKNNKVAFEMDCSHVLVTGEKDCSTTMEFESVCGVGFMEILNDMEKKEALSILMKHYKPKESYTFGDKALNGVTTLKLTVKEISGKASKKRKI